MIFFLYLLLYFILAIAINVMTFKLRPGWLTIAALACNGFALYSFLHLMGKI